MGRWSRPFAAAFVRWLGLPPCLRWLDVGCGTGALTAAVLAGANPVEVFGVDPSERFVAAARARNGDARASFSIGSALALPAEDRRFSVAASGLVLNFVPDARAALRESTRVTAEGGTVAAYVWDYEDGMQMLRCFWEAAAALDPTASELIEGLRFPLCRRDPLEQLWRDSGLVGVRVDSLESAMCFPDFDDYWTPFLGGQGPAGTYAASLTVDHRDAMRELLRRRLPVASDGSIRLPARAWAVRGMRR
jgi:SAM-dependent methyltransferase